MPNQKGVLSPIILIGVAILAVILGVLYNQNKNQQPAQDTPTQTNQIINQEIKDIPYKVNEFLNNVDIKEYESVGMKIYTGNNPPDIEGTYKSDSLVIFYDKPFEDAAPVGTTVSAYNHRFYDQRADGTIKISRTAVGGDDQADGTGGFISGDNNCFSIFANVKDQNDLCSIDEATIYSACKTEEGLENLQAGFITKKAEGPGCAQSVPVGHLRIITEDDGLTELIKE